MLRNIWKGPGKAAECAGAGAAAAMGAATCVGGGWGRAASARVAVDIVSSMAFAAS